jgi:hypothetical protein
MLTKQEYIGDGVYASTEDGWSVRLSTQRENGVHYIYLEPQAIEELVRYVKRLKEGR